MRDEMQRSAMHVHSSVLLCIRHCSKPVSRCARKLFSPHKKHCGTAQSTESQNHHVDIASYVHSYCCKDIVAGRSINRLPMVPMPPTEMSFGTLDTVL